MWDVILRIEFFLKPYSEMQQYYLIIQILYFLIIILLYYLFILFIFYYLLLIINYLIFNI